MNSNQSSEVRPLSGKFITIVHPGAQPLGPLTLLIDTLYGRFATMSDLYISKLSKYGSNNYFIPELSKYGPKDCNKELVSLNPVYFIKSANELVSQLMHSKEMSAFTQ